MYKQIVEGVQKWKTGLLISVGKYSYASLLFPDRIRDHVSTI